MGRLFLPRYAVAALVVSAGCLLAFRSEAHDGEQVDGGAPGAPTAALSNVACSHGLAGPYPCSNVDLLAYLPLDAIGGGSGSDIWGWTDPLTGREYALFGRSTGTAFVDISDPASSVYLGDLPTETVGSPWREIKTYGNYALVVSEAERHGLQMFDLTQLRDVVAPPVTFVATARYDGFGTAHNVVVDEASGFAYAVGSNTCGGGLHMIDVHDPLQPTFAGCFALDEYTHDAQCVTYAGPDARFRGREICLNSNVDTLTIVDVTDKDNPRMLARAGYSGVRYTHQGWLTEDHAYFLLDDELDEVQYGYNTRTYVWDVSVLDNPRVVGVHTASTSAIDHNQFVRGDYVYQANYRAGLRVLHLDDLATATLREVAFFDIYPPDDATQFNGAWGTYPFFASGVVVVSGLEQGLFVLHPHLDDAPPPAAAVCSAAPRTECRAAGAGTLVLSDTTPRRRKLVWKWLDGAATTVAEFGDPVGGTAGYALCVYDDAGDGPELVMHTVAPAGGTCGNGRPCWRTRGRQATTGFRYSNTRAPSNGLVSVNLMQGGDGKAAITVSGRGPALGMPPGAGARLLEQSPSVVVQLVRADGGPCWEASYGAPAVRTATDYFKDTAN